MLKHVLVSIERCLSHLVPLYCVGRCCAVPSIVVAATLTACFVAGYQFCRFSFEHVAFDLAVATGAVVIHHASNDIIRHVRAWRRRNDG